MDGPILVLLRAGRVQSDLSKCIALNIDFYVAFSQLKITKAFSVGFSSRKKVRFETRETDRQTDTQRQR